MNQHEHVCKCFLSKSLLPFCLQVTVIKPTDVKTCELYLATTTFTMTKSLLQWVGTSGGVFHVDENNLEQPNPQLVKKILEEFLSEGVYSAPIRQGSRIWRRQHVQISKKLSFH